MMILDDLKNGKLKNKKGAYDFIYLYIFLQISVFIFLIILLYLSYNKPVVYPKITSDNFINLVIHSKNTIFDSDPVLQRIEYGVLNINSLDDLDNRYIAGSFNNFLAARFMLRDKKTIKKTYYNKKNYDNWALNKPINIKHYEYDLPVWYYNQSKSDQNEGLLFIDVYVSTDAPYTLESK